MVKYMLLIYRGESYGIIRSFFNFIFAVIVSSVLHNMFPKIPTAFIQIGLGVVIFTLPIPMHFEFDSEVFMMAVIAPLLFVEGTHVSRSKLLEYRKPVILMAMALVLQRLLASVTLYIDLDRFTNASCFRDSCDFMSY